jgi:hypothetical protein
MAQITFLTLDSQCLLPPGSTKAVLARPQIPGLKPYRLRIDPMIAPFFQIEDIRVGNRSMFPCSQSTPASQFMHGNGEPFDCEEIMFAMDFTMYVTNISNCIPRLEGPNGPTSARAGVPMQFIATWACLIVPTRHLEPRFHSRVEREAYERQLREVTHDGSEDIGSRIDHVPELGKPPIGLTPMPKRREHPGFGWDPGHDD